MILMKHLLLYAFLLLVANGTTAQADKNDLYKKSPHIPAFSFTRLPDSTKFVKADLKKNKAVLIIVFSPDCEHCQNEMKELEEHINLFKNAQIVMVSHLDYPYIKWFYNYYKVANYPNIIMGRDNSYFFGKFYNVKFIPAIFLYDKRGDFVRAFDISIPVTKIAAYL